MKIQDCIVKARVCLNDENMFEFIEFINGLNLHMHSKDYSEQVEITNQELKTLEINPSLIFEQTNKVLEKVDTCRDPRREPTIRRQFNKIRQMELFQCPKGIIEKCMLNLFQKKNKEKKRKSK